MTKHKDQTFASYVIGSNMSKFKDILNPKKKERGLLDFVTEELSRIDKKKSKKKKA